MNHSALGTRQSEIDRAVVLLSGGVDSTTLLHYVKKKLGVETVCALSVVYGQKHVREIEMAKWQARAVQAAEHRIVDISQFAGLVAGASALTDGDISVPDMADIAVGDRDQPMTYVPNRNMMMLSIAAAYAESRGAQAVYYGAQAQDEYGYWDCTIDFVSKINDVLALNRRNAVRVFAPFAGISKAEVVKTGIEMGIDYEHTWTCYRGGETPCGECPSCVERRKAFDA